MSDVDYLDFWLHCVHTFSSSYSAGALTGPVTGPAVVGRLSPAVFVVGTNRASLHDNVDQQLQAVSFRCLDSVEYLWPETTVEPTSNFYYFSVQTVECIYVIFY